MFRGFTMDVCIYGCKSEEWPNAPSEISHCRTRGVALTKDPARHCTSRILSRSIRSCLNPCKIREDTSEVSFCVLEWARLSTSWKEWELSPTTRTRATRAGVEAFLAVPSLLRLEYRANHEEIKTNVGQCPIFLSATLAVYKKNHIALHEINKKC